MYELSSAQCKHVAGGLVGSPDVTLLDPSESGYVQVSWPQEGDVVWVYTSPSGNDVFYMWWEGNVQHVANANSFDNYTSGTLFTRNPNGSWSDVNCDNWAEVGGRGYAMAQAAQQGCFD